MIRTVLFRLRLSSGLIAAAWLCVVSSGTAIAQHSSTGPTGTDTTLSPTSGNPTSPESQQVQEYVPKWYDMITNMPSDWSRYGRIAFTTENIPLWLGIGASTALLIATDNATWRTSDKWYHNTPWVKSASDIGEWIGDGRPQFGLAGAFALYGFVAGDARALRTASQTTETILACGAVVQVLKHITGRESPDVSTEPGGIWRFFPNQIQYHKHVPKYDAFPSGHVATALATITVVAENYSELTWIRPVGYVLIGILSVSMVNTGIHWYSDYPLALALGHSFGMLAAHPEGVNLAKKGDDGAVKISVAPTLNARLVGVQLSVAF